MKKIIIPLVIILIIIGGIIGFIIIKNNNEYGSKLSNKYTTVIILDTNIGYEIYLDKNNKVVKFIKYKNNNKEIIKNVESLDSVFDLIKDEAKEFRDEYNVVMVLMNNEGEMDIKEIEKKLNNSSDIKFDIRPFGISEKEDANIANKYTISSVKASLVNSVLARIKEVKAEDLVNKTIDELMDMESSANYCPNDYTLKGGRCYKENGTKEPYVGEKCPMNYYEYDGVCYRFGEDHEGEKLVCRDDFELVGDECIKTETHEGEGVCEKGEYNGKNCIYREDVGAAEEYCHDPNRYYYEHKCLATKPLLNGGCPGDENAKRNNRCVNFKDDMQDSSKRCGKGEALHTEPDGSFRCIKETKYDVQGYNCGPDTPIQDSKQCTHTEVYKAAKEKICINGATLVDYDVCIIKSDTVPKEVRKYCDEHSFFKNDKCVTYEDIEAIKSGS